MPDDAGPPAGLTRSQVLAFRLLAWGGVALGAVFTVLGVAAAVQSGTVWPLLVSLVGALIGWGAWSNVKLERAARPPR